MKLEDLIADGNRQRSSQEGNHVVLEGPEWDLIVATIASLKAQVSGAHEVIDRYDEIKATVQSQVLAGDAIRKAAGK